jgi:hypothetical protein
LFHVSEKRCQNKSNFGAICLLEVIRFRIRSEHKIAPNKKRVYSDKIAPNKKSVYSVAKRKEHHGPVALASSSRFRRISAVQAVVGGSTYEITYDPVKQDFGFCVAIARFMARWDFRLMPPPSLSLATSYIIL